MSDLASTYKQKLAEIRSQYPILHRFGDAWALSIYQQIQEGQLNEFVLTTVPPEKTIETLQKRFPKFETEQTLYDEVIISLDADNIWEVEKLIEFMDGYGWYPSVVDDGKYTQDRLDKTIVGIAKDKSITSTIAFEKKFDDKVELEPYYYHITSDVYADEIERIGLVPKSHSKQTAHPGRVYLLNPTSPSNIKKVAAALFNKSKPEIQEKTNYIIVYRVNTDKVNNLEVYEDPNFFIADGAVWTYKNIPPSALERFLEIDIK
jgi:hypothetical protein